MSQEVPHSREDEANRFDQRSTPDTRFRNEDYTLRSKQNSERSERLKLNEHFDRAKDFFKKYPGLNFRKMKQQMEAAEPFEVNDFARTLVDHPDLNPQGVLTVKNAIENGEFSYVMRAMYNNVSVISQWESPDYPKEQDATPTILSYMYTHASSLDYMESQVDGQRLKAHVNIYNFKRTRQTQTLQWGSE